MYKPSVAGEIRTSKCRGERALPEFERSFLFLLLSLTIARPWSATPSITCFSVQHVVEGAERHKLADDHQTRRLVAYAKHWQDVRMVEDPECIHTHSIVKLK